MGGTLAELYNQTQTILANSCVLFVLYKAKRLPFLFPTLQCRPTT